METNFIILCVSLTFCVLSLVVSIISFTFAFYCKAEVVGLKNSTHQIQFVPAEEEFKNISEQVKDDNGNSRPIFDLE